MVFLEFEKPLETLYEQLEKIREVGQGGDIDVDSMVLEIEEKIEKMSFLLSFTQVTKDFKKSWE